MRVGVLTYGMNNQLTGIGRYTSELIYAMRSLDTSLEIILLNPYVESTLPMYRDFEVIPVNSLRRLPAVLTSGSVVLHQVALKMALDIVHDPCGIAPFLWPRIGTAYKRVVTIHDAVPYRYPRTQPWLTRLTFRTLVPLSRWSADAIITDSECSRRDLMTLAGLPSEKIVVTPLGISSPSVDQLIEWKDQRGVIAREFVGDCPYFLYVGALNPRKNVVRLIEAFRRVLQGGNAIKLVVVGPRTWMSDPVLLEAHALGDAVVLTGFIDDEMLHRLYANATALVVPSLYEGFGLPILEGMAHGIPVISSNTSSMPEVAGVDAILIDPVSTDAITEAMLTILSDKGFAAQLSQGGRIRAAEFPWSATAEATIEVYRRLVCDCGPDSRA